MMDEKNCLNCRKYKYNSGEVSLLKVECNMALKLSENEITENKVTIYCPRYEKSTPLQIFWDTNPLWCPYDGVDPYLADYFGGCEEDDGATGARALLFFNFITIIDKRSRENIPFWFKW